MSNAVNVLTNLINQALFSELILVQNNSGQICNTAQTLNTNIAAGAVIDCPLNIGQSNVSTCTSNEITQILNNVDLTSLVNNAITQLQTNPSFQQLSAQVSQTSNINLTSYLQNLVKITLNTTTINGCVTAASTTQNLTVTLEGHISQCPSPTTFSQNARVYVLANCLGNAISNAVSSDAILSTALQNASAVSTTSSNTSNTAVLWIGLAVAVVLLVLLLMYLFRRKK